VHNPKIASATDRLLTGRDDERSGDMYGRFAIEHN
jgi:hypothetical protein